MSVDGNSTPGPRRQKESSIYSKHFDPLTPNSRRVLETSSGSYSSTHNDSVISPRQVLLKELLKDDPKVVTPASQTTMPSLSLSRSRSSADSVHSFPMYGMASPMSSTTAGGSEVSAPLNDPGILTFGTKIRLRFGEGKYLSMRSSESTSNRNTHSNTRHVGIYVDGNGIDGDDEQVFIIQNCAMRKDRKGILYSDVVAFQCIGQQSRLLSAQATDTVDAAVVAQRGPIITKQEAWSILRAPQPQENTSDNYVRTGDRIILKSRNSSRIAYRDTRSGATVVLLSDNDDTESTIEISKVTVPYSPYWNRSRPYLTGSYMWRTIDIPPHIGLLQQAPSSIQEQVLVDDILFAMLGVPGTHIRIVANNDEYAPALSSPPFSFAVEEDHIDVSLSILVSKMLPMCERYTQVSHFVEQKMSFEYGQIAHAFSAAIKGLLKEYSLVVAQLEFRARSGQLSLQKLWFYIQPSFRTINLLHRAIQACRNLYGGALLTSIHTTSASVGDGRSRDIFLHLLEHASVPFLRMLELWIYNGTVEDPYAEFMIKKDEGLMKEELQKDPWCKYWEKRYTIREDQVPIFFERLKDHILTTGKYLNIVRSCRREINCPFRGSINYVHGERAYEERIEQAHEFSSKLVLDLVIEEHQLLRRLVSLKHYFLMDQGDFFVEFMDIAEQELHQRANRVSASRLESLLHLALQTSSCTVDPYKDDLTCILSANNLMVQMEMIHQRSTKGKDAPLSLTGSSFNQPTYKAIDAFTLDYHVEWPLSLVISAAALNKYQMIFRHLFYCKHVERRLCDAWLNHQVTKGLNLCTALRSSYCLRQRMLHFQQNFGYYMVFEVVAPRWHDLDAKIRSVTTIDEILIHHKDFLDNCLKECLLTDPELLRVLTKLMNVCMIFADLMERFIKPSLLNGEIMKAERDAQREGRSAERDRIESEAALEKLTGQKKSASLGRKKTSTVDMRRARNDQLSADIYRDATDPAFVRRTEDLSSQFDHGLAEFMQKLLHQSHLQFNSHLSNLCTRLDYNGFYTNQ